MKWVWPSFGVFRVFRGSWILRDIAEVDGLVVDEKLLEGECRDSLRRRRRDGLDGAGDWRQARLDWLRFRK